MKRLVIMTAMLALFCSCTAFADAKTGKAAFEKSVCTGCHSPDYEGFGPNLTVIGKKYRGVAGAKQMLVGKVRNGSSGIWGPATMPSLPKSMVNDKDLSSIIDYILSL
jgi:cytochrome c